MDIIGKILIILPHIDDEFALVPLIKNITKLDSNHLKIIYCAERIFDSEEKQKKRRLESIISLELLGCQKNNITFLNDSFEICDLKLRASSKKIFKYIENLYCKENFDYIITLNFEGGHPDHDSLALIVNKFTKNYDVEPIYVPAYNYRKTLFIPYSVFRPLKSQKNYFISAKYNLFCWIDCLKVALIYKTEREAFIKLLPFILFKCLFSKKIYLSKILKHETVNWEESLSYNRYNVKKEDVLESTF